MRLGASIATLVVLLVVPGASGCGHDSPPGASDATTEGDAESGSETGETEPSGEGDELFRAAADVLGRRCTACHDDGAIAPFSLRTSDEAVAWAEAIAIEVTERTMPPWAVDDSGACNHYLQSAWLAEDEIDAIVAWVLAGAPAGSPADEARLAPPPLETLSVEAPVIGMEDAYVPVGQPADDYRCFSLDAGVQEDRWLTAYEVRPGNPASVHHVILYASGSEDGDAQAAQLDEQAEGPGYPCFGGPGVDGGRFLAGWAPGTGATRYPEGTGIRVEAGRRLILQVHYNTVASTDPDRTEIAVELATDVAREAEILGMADLELSLPPGQPAASSSSAVVVEDFGDADVLGVYPHMHTLGRTLHVDVERGGVDECFVDVPRWDFQEQRFYFYDEPLAVGDGDRATLSCTFDTTTRSEPVAWGEGTADEMCLAGFYLVRH